eukprot:355876-Chlamydomonas_euryale.AAC.1
MAGKFAPGGMPSGAVPRLIPCRDAPHVATVTAEAEVEVQEQEQEQEQQQQQQQPRLASSHSSFSTSSDDEESSRAAEYNRAMNDAMQWGDLDPYKYHPQRGLYWHEVSPGLICGSQPRSADDVARLHASGVTHIVSLQTDSDLQYWSVNLDELRHRCRELGVQHIRRMVGASSNDGSLGCRQGRRASIQDRAGGLARKTGQEDGTGDAAAAVARPFPSVCKPCRRLV